MGLELPLGSRECLLSKKRRMHSHFCGCTRDFFLFSHLNFCGSMIIVWTWFGLVLSLSHKILVQCCYSMKLCLATIYCVAYLIVKSQLPVVNAQASYFFSHIKTFSHSELLDLLYQLPSVCCQELS